MCWRRLELDTRKLLSACNIYPYLLYMIQHHCFLQHGNTRPRLSPQPTTITLHCRIPLKQVRQRHLRTTQHARTRLVLLHKVESLAVRHHSRLNWRRRRNAVARLGARRLCSRRRLGRCRCRCESDDANAEIRIAPHRLAVVADAGVPGGELLERDAVLGSHVGAEFSGLLEVEFVAVGDHAGLRGEWGGDAVAGSGRWLSRGCGLGRRRCGREANHADAEVRVSPHGLTVVSNSSVPCCELL